MSGNTEATEERTWTDTMGSAAWRAAVSVVAIIVLAGTTAGLGFFVYNGRVSPEPLLLLVGIIVGFLLGRIDAML